MPQFTRYNRFILFLLSLFTSLFAAASPTDTLERASNPLRAYDVHYYHLIVKVIPSEKKIVGYSAMHFTAKKKLTQIQMELFPNYEISGIGQGDGWCKYQRVGKHLIIDLLTPVNKGKSDSIIFIYSGKPPVSKRPPWDGGFVWTEDANKKPWVAVACEGIGASSWWPCKDVLSDEPDSMRISIQVPYGLQDISNGRFLGAVDNTDGYNQFDWKVNYPINLYDVTLNVGDYHTIHDTFHSEAGNLSLDYYVLPTNEAKALSYFTAQVKPMLRCFEKYFGPYPFTKDGYALVEDPYWGMEHQSAIAYGNHYKLNEYGFDFIIVHESAHEWWGNSLSVPDDSLMWLHESFATYSEALYLECTQGEQAEEKYLLMQRDKIQNKIPMLHPKAEDSAIRSDNDIYYKGTWMLHTLRHAINNDAAWFVILNRFQREYKYQFVTTRDFVGVVDTMAHGNYAPFFEQYLEYDSIPKLIYSISGEGKKQTLTYRWQADVPDFSMHVVVYIDKKAVRLTPKTTDQTYNLGDSFAGDIKVDTDDFYVKAEKH
jgi:aminopeptidase N